MRAITRDAPGRLGLFGNTSHHPQLQAWLGQVLDIAGPVILVQSGETAIGTILHLACQSLRANDCEICLAGAVTPTGGGFLLLKRNSTATADRDAIYAVIKGSGIAHCQGMSENPRISFINAQVKAINSALHMAQCSAESIAYVEKSETGIANCDQYQTAALVRAYQHDDRVPSFGTGKEMFGHLGRGGRLGIDRKGRLDAAPSAAHSQGAEPRENRRAPG